jgi:hypothetical protein
LAKRKRCQHKYSSGTERADASERILIHRNPSLTPL